MMKLSPFRAFLPVALMCVCMSGCSDFRFVNAVQRTEEDPRELLRLENPHAEMTSGSQVSARLLAKEASYSDKRRMLELTTMTLHSFDGKGKEQGVTQSQKGFAFFAKNERLSRNRNDIELVGGVVHDAVRDEEGTSISKIHIVTEHLLWDNAVDLFRGNTPFVAKVDQEGKRSNLMIGNNFVATKNMKNWIVGSGCVGSADIGDFRELAEKTKRELETSTTVVTEASEQKSSSLKQLMESGVVVPPKILTPNDTLKDNASSMSVPTVSVPNIYQNIGVPYNNATTP